MSVLDTAPRRARRLEHLTIAWNTIEGCVAIGSGIVSGSVALVAFGFDSFIEVFAAAVVLWQLRGEQHERIERSLRLIALSFFMLAGYIVVEASYDLILRERPQTSPVGIAITALSLIVMPLLARAKRRTAASLGNQVLKTEASETQLCAYLSATVLLGLVLHALFGWWWADPLAALAVAALAVREGREAWRGDTCCG